MSVLAACLRVQINDQPIELKNVLDFNPRVTQKVSMEQAVVFSLLRGNFIGNYEWSKFAPENRHMMPIRAGQTTTIVENMVGSFVVNHTDSDGSQNIYDTYEEIPHLIGAIAFNDYYLKQSLREGFPPRGVPIGSPPEWKEFSELVDMTAIEDLQALMNEKLTYFGMGSLTFDLVKEPTTLTIHRCTQQDIDNLSQGDHDPHIDMFDTVKAMLAAPITEADQMNYSAATYEAGKDIIVFKSDYRLVMTTVIENEDMAT